LRARFESVAAVLDDGNLDAQAFTEGSASRFCRRPYTFPHEL
jgi:hypothetical protein